MNNKKQKEEEEEVKINRKRKLDDVSIISNIDKVIDIKSKEELNNVVKYHELLYIRKIISESRLLHIDVKPKFSYQGDICACSRKMKYLKSNNGLIRVASCQFCIQVPIQFIPTNLFRNLLIKCV